MQDDNDVAQTDDTQSQDQEADQAASLEAARQAVAAAMPASETEAATQAEASAATVVDTVPAAEADNSLLLNEPEAPVMNGTEGQVNPPVQAAPMGEQPYSPTATAVPDIGSASPQDEQQ